jgi:hypothetical protein
MPEETGLRLRTAPEVAQELTLSHCAVDHSTGLAGGVESIQSTDILILETSRGKL